MNRRKFFAALLATPIAVISAVKKIQNWKKPHWYEQWRTGRLGPSLDFTWYEDQEIKIHVLDPIPFDPEWPQDIVLTQTMTKEEFRKRYLA